MEINGKQMKLEITFNTLCELEDMGIDLTSGAKQMSMVRGFIAVALHENAEQAGEEIEKFIENGGKLEDLVEPINKAFQESIFFQKLQAAPAKKTAKA